MDERQKELFIQAAIMGWACGLEHPYEWLANIEHLAMMMFKYTELNERVQEFQEAFLAFERECQGPLPEGVEPMTMAQFMELRNKKFNRE